MSCVTDAPKLQKKEKAGSSEPIVTSDELRRHQRVAAKAELRIRMEDEAKNSKMNGLKILNQWRKIMRLAKAESLKKDVEILSQNHERDVDRKDAILQMLDRFINLPIIFSVISFKRKIINFLAICYLQFHVIYTY